MSVTATGPGVCDRLRQADLVERLGKVVAILGIGVEASGLRASVGELCEIQTPERPLLAEVVGFRDERLHLAPLGDIAGVVPGACVRSTGRPQTVPTGPGLLGRVIDGFARPLDEGGPIVTDVRRSIHAPPPPALTRRRIVEPVETGVRAIDGLLPVGRGQRVGIFAGSGVGKSVLLGCLAAHARADVNVIGLVGERGREVREFIERDLGAEALRRSVVVVSTSDDPPLVRRQAAFVATAVAEHFRDAGQSVLLMMDSLTRVAMAQREIGLSAGEPPTTRGYPPSVFGLLPRLLERAGTTAGTGSITGLYTILVEADDMNDPIGDSVRAILDGHIVLSRDLAAANHFPAIDVLVSVSRLADDLLDEGSRAAAAALREELATYRDARDLVAIGAYVAGSAPRVDRALANLDAVNAFLRQGRNERSARVETLARLAAVAGRRS